ncbi:M3 family oligoendopeptidase [Aerococcaceae bacterium WS4759]|uniref:M3 family oligoendopeptidase n=1 Tax=Fundicoccus ignavus TaxID=2664442 RepID=A0A6I2GGE0_9LACT|nr:M3 family oligoendopeptidase [Fundicoccus ignavus]MRI85754.1 M3 family oligoendopeptidase [Fundicoccus ignavus]
MKFNQYEYQRPDMEQVEVNYTNSIAAVQSATSSEEAIEAVKQVQSLQKSLDTQNQLVGIRHSIDTRDTFYEEESAFWDENSPLIEKWQNEYYQAILTSDYLEAITEYVSKPFIQMAENSMKVFDPKIIPLLQTENKLSTEYSKLLASAAIEYKGETYNLSGLAAFQQSIDRDERKAVTQLSSNFFSDNLDELDRIYDELVKTRNQIALELGFKDFVEVGYLRMNRLDYNREDVEVYRQEVLKHVVPLSEEIFKRQAKRIGIEDLKYYDLNLEYVDGNAKPIGTPEEIVQSGVKMYHELSPETGEFIDFMVEKELLDLVTKPGKQGGGYCTYIPDYKSPYIFSNFNGTSGDVDVLTHEAGHAFQVYQSRWIETPEVIWPTFESCEIHSMSMEFIAWPWMELFFGDQTDKYKYSHLASGVTFLPYGVLVDHFQHEVYEKPNMTPEERRQTWRKLEKMYNPWKDYDGDTYFENGGFWMKQGHIFASPFYYIDYTLAQVCAFQFWKRTQIDQDETAWEDYLNICRLGGTQSFLQIVETANLKSPFEEGSLTAVIETIREYLNGISDEALQTK